MTGFDQFREFRESGDISSIVDNIPYARLIGLKVLHLGNELIFHMPPLDTNIGNPTLPALHGGVIGGFMESSAIIQIIDTQNLGSFPKVVDFSLDYLRAGRFLDTFCRCSVVRQGRRVANVSVTAWQTTRDEPIATARCHLLLDYAE
jgi:acyl-coenzyme A thioesterase PaaI-like protein